MCDRSCLSPRCWKSIMGCKEVMEKKFCQFSEIVEELEMDHKTISKPENHFSLPYFCSASCCPAPASKHSLRRAVLPINLHVGDQRNTPKPSSPLAAPSHPGIMAHVEMETCRGTVGAPRAGALPAMHPVPSRTL